ncbi:MAG: metal-dependent transcriptional regulator [Desulfobacterales bacterium]|nr:metal-dependent transcriptional regulator [Desulfobacterales bacterium]MDJ0990969.1 metal-dependent transcriptional regulator [Desulfobacterales bacterium]
MPASDALTASMEDYLEAIYHIVRKKQAARAKDIARRLAVNNSSVTGALRTLSEKGFINYAPYDVITLTPKGHKHAEDVVRRHEALMDFFTKVLCVDEAEASDAACKMEHAVSRTILNRLIRFVEFLEICPRGGESLIQGFKNHCGREDNFITCSDSLAECLAVLKKRQLQIEGARLDTVSLKVLGLNQRGKIIRIEDKGEAGRRLAELDITPGSMVEVIRILPETAAIEIKARGYRLTIGNEDAARIEVERYSA